MSEVAIALKWLRSDAARGLLLVVIRMVPIVSLSPVFGGEALPRRIRLGLAILLAVLLAPPLGDSAPGIPTGAAYAALVAKEAFIGLLFALFLRLAFEMLAAAGSIIDLARGASIVNLLDPTSRQQQSITSTLFLRVLIVVFYASGGHRLLLEALGRSLITAPIQEPLPLALSDASQAAALLALTGDLFLSAVQIAAPVVAIMFVTDVALALLSRVAPQIQVYFLGLGLKGTAGLVILLFLFHAAMTRFSDRITHVVTDLIGG